MTPVGLVVGTVGALLVWAGLTNRSPLGIVAGFLDPSAPEPEPIATTSTSTPRSPSGPSGTAAGPPASPPPGAS